MRMRHGNRGGGLRHVEEERMRMRHGNRGGGLRHVEEERMRMRHVEEERRRIETCGGREEED